MVRNHSLMTIGGIARATGIPASTLRTWERRYGFPKPSRSAGGQRLYRSDIIDHLRLVSTALEQGHGARQILSVAYDELERLLGPTPRPEQPEGARWMQPWQVAVERMDGSGLSRLLEQEWSRVGALPFLESRVAPFLRWVGEAWVNGALEIHQEHLASDQVLSLLDRKWRLLAPPIPARAVCATLPGEAHDLGVYLSAAAIAAGGARPLVLSGTTPVRNIAIAAREMDLDLVAISLSARSTEPHFAEALVQLRARLPEAITLVVGGAGAPATIEGVYTGLSLTELSTLAAAIARRG